MVTDPKIRQNETSRLLSRLQLTSNGPALQRFCHESANKTQTFEVLKKSSVILHYNESFGSVPGRSGYLANVKCEVCRCDQTEDRVALGLSPDESKLR